MKKDEDRQPYILSSAENNDYQTNPNLASSDKTIDKEKHLAFNYNKKNSVKNAIKEKLDKNNVFDTGNIKYKQI